MSRERDPIEVRVSDRILWIGNKIAHPIPHIVRVRWIALADFHHVIQNFNFRDNNVLQFGDHNTGKVSK